MKTSLWGSHAWKFLHAVTFAYPENPSEAHKDAARHLFTSLKLLLPCGDCCSHYCMEFDKHHFEKHLQSRDLLSKWLVDFHNKVNKRLQKPEETWESAAAIYLNQDDMCTVQTSCNDSHETRFNFFYVIVALVCVACIAFFVTRRRNK